MIAVLGWIVATAALVWVAWRCGFRVGLEVGTRIGQAKTDEARAACRNAAWVRAGYHRVAARPLSGLERN